MSASTLRAKTASGTRSPTLQSPARAKTASGRRLSPEQPSFRSTTSTGGSRSPSHHLNHPPHHHHHHRHKLTKSSSSGPEGMLHLETKKRIQEEMDAKWLERDRQRKDKLAAIVVRAFQVSHLTGDVVMGKHHAILGDEGIPLITEQLQIFKHMSKLSVCNHGIGPAGALELADALLNTPLQHLNLSNNRIGSKGAEMLASVLSRMQTLHTLILADNEIGPSFPTGLCLCSALTELQLQYNCMTDLDTSVCLHPSFKTIDLAGNPFCDGSKHLLTMDTDSVLREMLEGILSSADEKCRAVGTHNADGTIIMFPIDELGVSLPLRWNKDPGVLAALLKKYTSLKTLNGLHEWAVPPLAPSETWDLSGKLTNPVHECIFIGNRLSHPNTIMALTLNDTIFYGQAATALADCIKMNSQLSSLNLEDCKWDDGITAVANAVAGCKSVTTLNRLTLLPGEETWDLRGALNDRIEMFFVARIIAERKAILAAIDLRENHYKAMDAARLTGAIDQACALTCLNNLSLPDSETTWDLRRKILNGRIVNIEKESHVGSTMHSAQYLASMKSGGFSSLRSQLQKRQTNGALMFELRFLANRMQGHSAVLELQLAENGLGDRGVKEMEEFFLVAGRTLQVLHLNNNRIGQEGGQALGKVLARMPLISTLRLNDNPLGWLGVEAVLDGLGARSPVGIQNLYMNNTQMGPMLPTNLSTLVSLQVFSACENGISTLNSDISKLPLLTGLWIDGNDIEVPPAHIVKRGLRAITDFLKLPEPLKRSKNSRLLTEAASKGAASNPPASLISKWQTVRDVFKPGLASKVAMFRRGGKAQMKVQAHLHRHGHAIKSVRFHSDYSLIATCGVDETLKLWEPNEFSEGKEWTCSHSLRGHKDTIYACAFTPTHQPILMASASRDKTVVLWIPHQEAGQNAIWMCGQVLGGRLGRGEIRDGKKQHTGAVRVVEFFPDLHKTGKMMLASGGEDDTIRVWSPKEDRKGGEEAGRHLHGSRVKDSERVARDDTHYAADGEMGPVHELFMSFSAGKAAELDEEEHLVVVQQKGKKSLEKRMGNVGRRADSMDLFELMQCCDMLGLTQWLNKSTITRLFREVNRHAKSDEEVHELDFVEFCELLYWMGRKAQRQTEGEEVTEGPLTWNRYGNMESILGIKIERLHKFEEDNLDDDDPMKRDMGWDCLFTLRGHAGVVTSLAWLPTEDVVLASGSGDESVMLWHHTESRGRGTWTNVFKGVGHDSFVHRLSVGRGRERVYLASSSADNTIMLWKISVRPIMRETLDGKVVGNAYSLIKGDRVRPGLDAVFTSCQFRSDGAVLVTGLSDGHLLFWTENVDGIWENTRRMLCHTAPIESVSFGGRQHRTLLITGSDDCKCCLIDTKPFAEFVTRKSRRASISGRRPSLIDRPAVPGSVDLPPRTECQTFTKRLAAAWTLQMEFKTLQRISNRLDSSTARKDLLLTPNHGGTLSMRCQPGSSRHDIRLIFQPNTVWFRTRFRVSAVNVEAMEVQHFEDLHVVGPIVSLSPQSTMFRKPVQISVPHHAAAIEGLVLLQCPFPTDSTCNWTPVDDVTFSSTHAHAMLESFTCFFIVVHRGLPVPDDVTFCIPETTDGRPLQHLHVSSGEHWVGQIEIVACASVQRSAAISDCFQPDLAHAPLHTLPRGTAITEISTHAFSLHRKVVVHCHCVAPINWTGIHAIVPIEIRVTPGHGGQHSPTRSPPPRSPAARSSASPASVESERLLLESPSSQLVGSSRAVNRSSCSSTTARSVEQSQLFTLEEDLDPEHLDADPVEFPSPPTAASRPETSLCASADALSPNAATPSPKRPATSLDAPLRDLSSLSLPSPESLRDSLRHPSPDNAAAPQQHSFFGATDSKRPFTSLPNLNNSSLRSDAQNPLRARAPGETMYVGLALRNEDMEVVAMMSSFRLTVLPQRLSVVLHPPAPSRSRRGSAATTFSSIRALERPGTGVRSGNHGRLHTPNLLAAEVDSQRRGRAQPQDRQVTLAVEIEEEDSEKEMTMAEVRVRVGQALKAVAVDAAAQWAAPALAGMRFQLDTRRVVTRGEEKEVLASEQLPSVGMICVEPDFDEA